MRRHRRCCSRVVAAGVAVATVTLTACGGSGGADANRAETTPNTSVAVGTSEIDPIVSGDRALAGIVRDPPPLVDETTLPSLSSPGDETTFRADPGSLKAVYFGYTNCPDVCPTTMSDWAITLRRLPADVAAQVQTLMVTVDPDRDNDILTGYVRSFVPDAEAAGTTDADLLSAAAEPFGVSYDVATAASGDIEVAHSGFLYLVDDQGRLVVTWPFGTDSVEMSADVLQVFDAQVAAS